ncbi:hypothetical protein ATY77_21635 [Rhizobium sp. R634]|nr:hypothetical protein ATY77_21635 [Rhizobium sp. R634]
MISPAVPPTAGGAGPQLPEDRLRRFRPKRHSHIEPGSSLFGLPRDISNFGRPFAGMTRASILPGRRRNVLVAIENRMLSKKNEGRP